MSLFEPIEVGDIDLRHRIGVPPLQNDIVVPNELNAEWYTKMVEVPETLLIVRLSIPNVDGATKNNDEINHWKEVVEKVHQLRSFIYLQLWLSDEYTFDQGIKKISTKNIGEIVRGYVQAARTAIEVGFDGVEIGGEDKTLLHLFFEDSNNRKDAYGSFIENKVRLLNEVVDALSKSIGRSKVGVSLSPWERSYSYGPIPIYSYFLALQELNQKRGRGIAYIRLVKSGRRASNWDFVRKVWSGVLIRDENLSPEAGAKALAVDPNALIAFREYFLSNPHLVKSIKTRPLSAEYDSDAIDIRNHLDQNLANSSYTSQADTEQLDESKSNLRKKNLILNAFVMSTPNSGLSCIVQPNSGLSCIVQPGGNFKEGKFFWYQAHVEQGSGAYQIKIVASVVVTLAETDAKAREKYEEYLSYADIEGALTLFGGWTGYDLSQYGDNDDFRFEGPPAIQSTLLDINNSRKWSKSDIARELVLGGFSRKLIGSPKTVADRLERWALESDLDGFNFAHITSPGTYEDIVDLLIPELQQRGLFHYDYANTSTARGQVFGHDHLPSDHPGYQYKYDD